MPPSSSKLAVGAIVSVKKRCLHGADSRKDLPVDLTNRVCDLEVASFTHEEINRKDVPVAVLFHPSKPGDAFYASVGMIKVIAATPAGAADVAAELEEEEDEDSPEHVEDEVVDVDDGDDFEAENEDDAAENEDDANDENGEQLPALPELKARTGTEFHFDAVLTGVNIPHPGAAPRRRPQWLHHTREPELLSPGYVFSSFFPETVMERLLTATNRRLAAKGHAPTSKEELLAVIGAVMMTASLFSQVPRRDLFYPSASRFNPHPDLRSEINHKRCEAILASLALSDTEPPPYKDQLFHLREMQRGFNAHMRNIFRPGTVTCLDESMVAYNNDKVPAWVYVGRKPHPHGFEYHTIADAETAIIFKI